MAQTKRIKSLRVVKAGSSPDIDSDFNTIHRADALKHVRDTYGADNVSAIGTFGTLKAKSAFKTMCTIYEIPFAQANKISDLIPEKVDEEEVTFAKIYDPSSPVYGATADFRSATSASNWEPIVQGAIGIEGKNKSTGVHACGYVISSKPLIESVPLQVRQKDGAVVSQWTYPELESLGLIKMDFLGLDTVDLIQHTVENIMKGGKTPPNMMEIVHGDMDDPKTFALLQRGETIGTFQLASEGMQELLKRIRPTTIHDIIAATALYRPGPMGMNSHTRYADRKNGREAVDYIHPDFKGSVIEEIIGNTFGLCVPAGTPILDVRSGKFVAIENIPSDGSFHTTSLQDESGLVETKPVVQSFATGKKPILKINLNGGRTLRVSETHPVKTQRGYVEAKDIVPGDFVAAVNGAPLVSESATPASARDLARAYLLGAFIGDGSMNGKAHPYITNSEEPLRQAIELKTAEAFDSVFISRNSRVQNGEEYTQYLTFRDSTPPQGAGNYDRSQASSHAERHEVNLWLKSLGYDGSITMWEKTITNQVMEFSNEELRALLAGLWDTDGGNAFTTTSERLFEGIKQILIRLGVDFGESKTPYENPIRPNRVAYRIHPRAKDFNREISRFVVLERKKNLKEYDNVMNSGITKWRARIIEDVISYAREEGKIGDLRGRRSESGTKVIGIKSVRTFIAKHFGKFSCDREMYDLIKNAGVLSKKTVALIEQHWKIVHSVEADGVEECYDIEVADNHNFLVNGLVVHNCVYQEQIIRIANQVAGMTLQEGDDLRSAMGKKKMEKMASMKPKFIEGGMANGYSEEAMVALWNTCEEFAKYGFNLAHSVAYGINAYQTAYLKANYPVEFMAALIAQNVNKREKLLPFLQEARRMGLKVGSIDVNSSEIAVSPDYENNSDFDIVFGFAGASAVSEDNARIIVEERKKAGKFKSVQDMVTRCYGAGVQNSKIFENIAKAGGFDGFGVSRRAVVESVRDLISMAKTKASKGASLFDLMGASSAVDSAAVDLTSMPEYPHVEKLKHEASVVGLYLTSHPLSKAGPGLSKARTGTIATMLKSQRQMTATITVAVTEVEKKIMARGGRRIAVTLDDGTSYLRANVSKNLVKMMDKGIAQELVRKLYEDGQASVPEDMVNTVLDASLESLQEVEKNSVYVMSVTFRPPRGEEQPYSAVVNSIEPLILADNGSLPIRMRLLYNDDNKAKATQLARKLPQAIAKRNPGEFPIFLAFEHKKNLRKVNEEALYAAAIKEITSGNGLPAASGKKDSSSGNLWGGAQTNAPAKAKNSSNKEKARSWPPKVPASELYESDGFSSVSEMINSATYVDTGLRADKSKATELDIEKYLGVENYDFGVWDPSIIEE